MTFSQHEKFFAEVNNGRGEEAFEKWRAFKARRRVALLRAHVDDASIQEILKQIYERAG